MLKLDNANDHRRTQVVLQQDYVSADETYHKVLLAKIKPTDKGSKKGYQEGSLDKGRREFMWVAK